MPIQAVCKQGILIELSLHARNAVENVIMSPFLFLLLFTH